MVKAGRAGCNIPPWPLPLSVSCPPPPTHPIPPTQVSPLGPVTLVFAKVEGGSDWRAVQARSEAEQVSQVQDAILRIILTALQDVPGGYLCRVQDGEFKYMLAFDTAQGALGWCLVSVSVS